MRYDTIIAIDPDAEKSGVAKLDVAERKSWADTLPFPLLVEYVRQAIRMNKGRSTAVVVEASWHDTHNWHLLRRDSLGIAVKKGYDVGRNHETGKKIIEMLNYYGIEVVEKKPLRKTWQGKDRKITHTEITAITGWDKKRSNQEERDAMLLAWDYSNLPIIIKKP